MPKTKRPVDELLTYLTPREERVFAWHHLDGLSLEVIGKEKLSMTRQRIGQILHKAELKLTDEQRMARLKRFDAKNKKAR
jgi:DNA-directed RNA polymerase sigma subunit (sigma70/sigma32)